MKDSLTTEWIGLLVWFIAAEYMGFQKQMWSHIYSGSCQIVKAEERRKGTVSVQWGQKTRKSRQRKYPINHTPEKWSGKYMIRGRGKQNNTGRESSHNSLKYPSLSFCDIPYMLSMDLVVSLYIVVAWM